MNGGWSLPENTVPVTRRGSSNVNSVMSRKCFGGFRHIAQTPREEWTGSGFRVYLVLGCEGSLPEASANEEMAGPQNHNGTSMFLSLYQILIIREAQM